MIKRVHQPRQIPLAARDPRRGNHKQERLRRRFERTQGIEQHFRGVFAERGLGQDEWAQGVEGEFEGGAANG